MMHRDEWQTGVFGELLSIQIDQISQKIEFRIGGRLQQFAAEENSTHV